MKIMKIGALLGLALGLGIVNAPAQERPPGPGGPGGHGGPPGGLPPAMPLMTALDSNGDGELDAGEINNAPTALLKLDKNGNGKLDIAELMPPNPGSGTNQFRPPQPPDGGKRPSPPLLAALDVNNDGELDASEIAGASTALLKLDTDGDGKLSKDELRPSPPPSSGFSGKPRRPGNE